MKKQILILAVLVFSGVAVVAQQRPDNRRFENKGDYCEAVCHRFSEACSLSDDDAAKFKEIYEAYYSELQSIREQYRPQRRSGMSDEEVESQTKGRLERSKKIAELKEKYYGKFKEVLTPRQIERLYNGKGDFRGNDRRYRDYHHGYCDYDGRGCYGGRHRHRGCCD